MSRLFPTHHNNVHAISASTLEVYDSDFAVVMTIPQRCIDHLPPVELGLSRLVLCRNYGGPNFDCPKGDACKFVHARLDATVKSQSIHVNYAWRRLEDVKYARLKPGRTLSVAAPNNRTPSAPLPSEYVLRTKGSSKARSDATLQHCAHYYFNRMCNRGENCNFIHSVYLDPAAGDFEKAPSPAAYLHRLQSEAVSIRCCHTPVASDTLSDCSTVATPRTPEALQDGAVTAIAAVPMLPLQEPTVERFRYDPYSYDRSRVTVSCCA